MFPWDGLDEPVGDVSHETAFDARRDKTHAPSHNTRRRRPKTTTIRSPPTPQGTMSRCPFCTLSSDRVVWRSADGLILAIRDAYPVSPGHTLLIPTRHVASYFDATDAEKAALWAAVDTIKETLDATHRPAGYNVGFNAGPAAGQTVMHLHVHVIPRFEGDVEDPRGGVRGVIPHKQKYRAG